MTPPLTAERLAELIEDVDKSCFLENEQLDDVLQALRALASTREELERVTARSHGIDLGLMTVWMKPGDAETFAALMRENFFKQMTEAAAKHGQAERRVAELEGQIATARAIVVGVIGMLEHELLTPDDMWADHINAAQGNLSTAATLLAPPSRPDTENT